jgi:hypothetical protein
MSGNRSLSLVLLATLLVAGCSGGATAPPLGQAASDSTQSSQHFQATSLQAADVKKVDDAIGGSGSAQPTWQFLQPLDISDSGALSVPKNARDCAAGNQIAAIWYVALHSFTLPNNGATLPACTFAASAQRRGKLAPAAYNNFYIVEMNVGPLSASITPIAGPFVNDGSVWYFQPEAANLSFTGFGLYSFFIASYTGPTLAQPNASCTIGSTTCTLAGAPTAGNKLVVVVSDGSGALPNLVVDSAGNPLTRETISPNCGHCVAVYDETVPSGISGEVNYTTSGGGVYYPYESEIYELANVTSGRFASVNTPGVPTSLAATIAGVTNNDIQLCAYIQSTTSTGNLTLGFSNGGASEAYDYQTATAVFAHATAALNAQSTCTANNINTGYEAGMAYADYP